MSFGRCLFWFQRKTTTKAAASARRSPWSRRGYKICTKMKSKSSGNNLECLKSLSIFLFTFCRLHKVLRIYFSWRLLQFQPSLVEISMGSPKTSNGDVNLRAYIVMRNRVEKDTVPHRFVHGSTILFAESLFGKQRDDTLYWFSNSFSLWSMILRLGECAWTNFGTRRGQKDLILSLQLWEWELTTMLLYLDFMFFSSSSASLVKNCICTAQYPQYHDIFWLKEKCAP